jgi:hypothetical protein
MHARRSRLRKSAAATGMQPMLDLPASAFERVPVRACVPGCVCVRVCVRGCRCAGMRDSASSKRVHTAILSRTGHYPM